jgi:hypothetical protein
MIQDDIAEDDASMVRPRMPLLMFTSYDCQISDFARHLTGEPLDPVRPARTGFNRLTTNPTSPIYGPAKFAIEPDAVCESRPVQEIAPRLVALFANGLPNPNSSKRVD